MTDTALLDGKNFLVIEDDYYLASDEAELLRKGGAHVVGCTGDTDEALQLIAKHRVDYALVDINLGVGPSYEAAAALKERNIPFMFTTGYDAASIPSEFKDVPLLEKPFTERKLIGALGSFV
jgi:CheY-like chemotaxis protein